MFEIIPGIGTLEKNWTEIERKIELVRPFVKTVQIDIVDGQFANHLTFLDPAPFAKYTQDLFFELHLMVEEPVNYLESWARAGFRRFLGQVEKMSSQSEFVSRGKRLGEVGLALDGPTPLAAITVPYEALDALLIYTSKKAGLAGPPFRADRLTKVKRARRKTKIAIEVDGGVNDQTIHQAQDAGATRFVSTSFLFRNGEIENNLKRLKAAMSYGKEN